jgi:hypothetical protein
MTAKQFGQYFEWVPLRQASFIMDAPRDGQTITHVLRNQALLILFLVKPQSGHALSSNQPIHLAEPMTDSVDFSAHGFARLSLSSASKKVVERRDSYHRYGIFVFEGRHLTNGIERRTNVFWVP